MQQIESTATGRVPVVLSYRKIVASIRRQKFRTDEQEQLAAYVEGACRRHGWNTEARAGITPPHEVALATVVVLEGLLRRLDNRMRNGRLRSTGFEERDVWASIPPMSSCPHCGADLPLNRHANQRFCSETCREAAAVRVPYQEPKERVEKPPEPPETEGHGYVGSPGTTNGGVAGYGTTHDTTQAKNEKPMWGVEAFRSVEGCGGIPELAWYYCSSAFELGMTTSFDAMVQASIMGPSTCGGSPPMGPNDHAKRAAERQSLVRGALRELWPALCVVLEIAYEDRRRRTQDVKTYGHGVANLMAHAEAARRDIQESREGKALDALQRLLMALTGRAKRSPPAWQAMTAGQAKRLLDAAHEAYVSIRYGYQLTRPKRRDRVATERLEAVPVRAMSPRRQMFQVVRRAA